MPFARGVRRNSIIEFLNFQQKRVTKKIQKRITSYLRRNDISNAIIPQRVAVDLTSKSDFIDLTGDFIDLTGDNINTGAPIIDLTGN